MQKKVMWVVWNYTFDKSTMQVTCNWVGTFIIEQVDTVMNLTTWDILYAWTKFSDGIPRTGSISAWNIIDLDFNDAGLIALMANTDSLKVLLNDIFAEDRGLDVIKQIPQAFAPVISNSSENLVTSSAIWSWIDVWTVQGSVFSLQNIEFFLAEIVHTHSTSTWVKAKLTVSDSTTWTFSDIINKDWSVDEYILLDTTWNKAIEYNVAPYLYGRIETIWSTAVTDTVTINITKTLNS